MFLLYADRNQLTVTVRETLTSGSVNVARMKFEFSPHWEGLAKQAVFVADVGAGEGRDRNGAASVVAQARQCGGVRECLARGAPGARGGADRSDRAGTDAVQGVDHRGRGSKWAKVQGKGHGSVGAVRASGGAKNRARPRRDAAVPPFPAGGRASARKDGSLRCPSSAVLEKT